MQLRGRWCLRRNALLPLAPCGWRRSRQCRRPWQLLVTPYRVRALGGRPDWPCRRRSVCKLSTYTAPPCPLLVVKKGWDKWVSACKKSVLRELFKLLKTTHVSVGMTTKERWRKTLINEGFWFTSAHKISDYSFNIFLTVRPSVFPIQRVTCHHPNMIAERWLVNTSSVK